MREISNQELDQIRNAFREVTDEKDAEIERLKASFKTVNDLVNTMRQKRSDDASLITRAADALEDNGLWRGGLNTTHSKLLNDLREAAI